jgi:hypothetical protein
VKKEGIGEGNLKKKKRKNMGGNPLSLYFHYAYIFVA